MGFVSPRRALHFALLLTAPAILSPSPCLADEAAIRQQIANLADRNPVIRQSAIESFGQGGDDRVVEVLQAYQQGNLYTWKGRVVLSENVKVGSSGKRIAPLLDPLTKAPLPDAAGKPLVIDANELAELSPGRPERRLVQNMLRFLKDFVSPNADKRLDVVHRLGESPDAAFLKPLGSIGASDPDWRVRRAAREAAALTQLGAELPEQTPDERMAAIATLKEIHSRSGRKILQQLGQDESASPQERSAIAGAIHSIDRYQYWVSIGRDLTFGLSAGSVLILMALGLSIIYGQMGVINMAHGELMMIGAYATHEMQVWCGHTPDHPRNWYFLAALPVSFFAAAAVGWLIERLVVQHLYGRVLETLLATWGVGLVLIQAARVRYGDNIGVNSPTWLVGSFEVIPDLTISSNRLFILVLCALCVLFLYWLMNYTRIGLKIRATVQSRETAESLGVHTRRIDGFTFALGAGLAGVAGYALTLIAGVTPDMGQNYVVDSFLVVVVGGVGKLAGSVWAGLGMGALTKILEPATFGMALLTAGLIMTIGCWIWLTVLAFRQNRKLGWLTLLVPIPAPFAFKYWARPGVARLFWLYLFGLSALVIGLLRNVVLVDILSQDIRTIWSRVLILLAVVIFIQWRPAGLFPPKGRLADV